MKMEILLEITSNKLLVGDLWDSTRIKLVSTGKKRCDNGTEFKNNDMNQFCGMKGIKREFSVARTPQQNGVAKRKNMTLIEASRTMLADLLLPTTFWTKADPLGKFDGKADEGFFVRYSINSKAFRVFNTRTRKVEENLHITFLENKPNVVGSEPDWLFDIDLLTNSMNYELVTTGNQTNKNAGIKDNTQQYILLPLLYDSLKSSEDAVADDAGKRLMKNQQMMVKEMIKRRKEELQIKKMTRIDSTVSPYVSAVGQSFTNADDLPTDPLMPDLEDTANLLNTGIFGGAYDDEDVGEEDDLNNLETTMNDEVRFQVTPKVSHLHAMKKIFRYLKGQPKLGLWYPRDSPFNLEAFFDSDYTGSSLNRKSTTGAEYVAAANCYGQVLWIQNQMLDYRLKQLGEPKEVKDTKIPQSSGPPKKVSDEAVYTGEDDRVVRVATTATSLEAKQESGNIYKTRSTATLNEPSPQGTGSGSGPRCQDTTLGDADAQTRFETASKQSCDPPLLEVNISRSGEDRGYIPGSDEGRLNIKELMDICKNMSNRVLALETTRTAQDLMIRKLKKKVRRLEKKLRPRTLGMKLFKIGTSRRKSLDKENVFKQGRNLKTRPMFEEGDFDNDFDDIDDMVNEAMKKIEGDTVNAVGAVNTATTRVSAASASVTTAGCNLLTRGKDAALIEQMEDIQARMDAEELLAEKLQQEEREQFTIDEKSRMLVEMISKRKRKGKLKRRQEKQLLGKNRGEKLNDLNRDDEVVNVESLATKYPIVDWKIHVLSEDNMYYEIIKGDGSTKFYKIFTEMLDDFDRQDVLDLYRLVKERFKTASLEGYDRLLWGDLHYSIE
ncbi:putative ribonuclease H-like domain-containing protein [Tanacetum coccineum]